MQTKTLGRTGIEVPIVGLGGANLGFLDPNGPYNYYVTRHGIHINFNLAIQTVRAALNAGVRFIDTAPLYQGGISELNIKTALELYPHLAKQVLVTTKIGRMFPADGFDHSSVQAMYSYKGSVARLERESFDILYLHDPMGFDMEFVMNSVRGSMQALRDLRWNGKVKWIGIAANDPETAADYIETGMFDVATISGAWSLINQKALERIFPAAEKYNVGIVVTTALERGLLATGALENRPYLERSFSPDCLKRVAEMKQLCGSFGIPLAAAALRWPTRHPQVACVIPGARTPEEAHMNTQVGLIKIPEEFWKELEPLVKHFDSYQEV